MVKDKKNILSLQSILDNTPETIEVPEFGSVVVKCPSTKDKLDSKREALEITKGLTEADCVSEQSRILAIKMMVEPKFTLDDYLSGNDIKVSMVLDTIAMWYSLKIKNLNAKRQGQLRDFLEQMKES